MALGQVTLSIKGGALPHLIVPLRSNTWPGETQRLESVWKYGEGLGGLNYKCLLCPRREAFKVTPEPQPSRTGDGPGGRAAAAVPSVQLLKACGETQTRPALPGHSGGLSATAL